MSSTVNKPQYRQYNTLVGGHEKYVSWLMAAVMLVGLALVILLMLWLTSLDWTVNKEPMFIEEPIGDQNPEGIAEDFEEPGVEELPDVAEPQLMDAIEALTSDPSTQRAAIEAVHGNMPEQGTGKGLGDHRTKGPGTGGTGGRSPADRWDIRYTTGSEDEYFKQLDFFNIEVGAIDPVNDQINYVKNLSAPTPTRRTGTRKDERRINFKYRKGYKLLQWDMKKLKAGGVETSGKIIVQFYPDATRQKLMELEAAKLNGASVETIDKTIFTVQAKGGGFEYYVTDIKFK
jgi:hypothetical protein